MTPAERLAFLEAELRKARARIAVLEARLRGAAVAGLDVPDWKWSLTRQERALVQALWEAYPRVLTNAALDQAIPHHDHAADRGPGLIPTIISRARRKIPGGIERIAGVGYRLTAQAAARLSAID
jgi:DNA-binding response OmpR family regulator